MLIVLTSGNPCITSTLGREVRDDIVRLRESVVNFDALVKLVTNLLASITKWSLWAEGKGVSPFLPVEQYDDQTVSDEKVFCTYSTIPMNCT